MDKTLRLKVYVDGVNDTPFPSAEDQIEIGAFRYDAKRMGGAPTITATVNYPTCLDKEWNDLVYTELNGEKYFLKQTPTSTLSNEDARYKHDLVMVAERVILDDAYFFDAVVGNPLENDKPVTNSTNFNFYGSIEEFVKRMNASLQYTKLQSVSEDGVISGYRVILDDDVVTREQKQVVFDGAAFSQALQECYNTFGIPFYFDGKEIHVGYTNNVISDVLEYGVDGALLSASKQNANFKVVNRATGTGSKDNIPYYYPNNAPKGDIKVEVNSANPLSVDIVNPELYSNKVALDDTIEYKGAHYTLGDVEYYLPVPMRWDKYTSDVDVYCFYQSTGKRDSRKFRRLITTEGETCVTFYPDFTWIKMQFEDGSLVNELDYAKVQRHISFKVYKKGEKAFFSVDDVTDGGYEIHFAEAGEFYIESTIEAVNPFTISSRNYVSFYIGYSDVIVDSIGWYYSGEKVSLDKIGLSVSGQTSVGDTITQRPNGQRIKTSDTLQPSIYRATKGAERFYNAINYPFIPAEGYELKYGEYIKDGEVHNDAYKKDNGEYYEFTNEYKEARPREHVFAVDDIKPTIKEMTNDISWSDTDSEGNPITVFQRIDMFSEFAYDRDDNDETYIDENGEPSFKHPYFFGKLRKLDFNLFDCAIEQQPMTISMTAGHCGACNFEIGVSEDYPQMNPVQVDENGNLVYDEEGRVLCGLEDFQDPQIPQDEQQDTINHEVWIALKKEETTYGILMPKAPKYEGDTLVEAGHRPVACSNANSNDGDTFVILGIKLPEEYILHAERKLEKAIVKYIWENNVEKFNFSVNFSRIFLAENPSITDLINENARLTRVKYNGDEYMLYVSSYSYVMNEGDVLPEIRVELDDTLTISQNALQNAINEVKGEIGQAIDSLDVAAIGSRYFLRKDVDDVAQATIDFRKGVFFGEGGEVRVDEDGSSAKLTIDYLEVTKKATFTSLEIQEKTHVGGQFIISPAAMTCSNVEELDNVYRCYFQTSGEGKEGIFNQFVVGDQAISQTFNEWGGHYYWRLVVEVGEDYIDLSKTDCDSSSDIPSSGDKIIQLGNRTNISRQAAQVLSAHGEDAPSFIMYNGIDSYSLYGKNITGVIWNPQAQEPQMYSYGSFFFGDRELEGNFITFQTKDGETEKTLTINADVQLGGGSTGLGNLSEWKEQSKKVEEVEVIATNAANEAENNKVTVQRVQAQVNTIEDNVSEALELAARAQETANEATQKLEDLASDNIISPSEKQALRTELANVNADYIDIEKQYQKYIVEFDVLILTDGKTYVTEDGFVFNVEVANTNWTAFETAQLAYKKDLINKIETEGSVEIGDLLTKQNAYYSARTSILEDISLAIKAEADYSVKRAAAADKAANEAKESFAIADASIKNLDQKITDVETGVNKSIEEINLKLDGVVESYFEDYTPSRNNEPAATWISEGTEANHVGDTFTNTSTTGDNAGKSWRWLEQADGTYDWQLIADSDATKALALASQAIDALDGKSATFLKKPSNYEEGDLWIVGSDYIPTGYSIGDLLSASTNSTSYVESHWSKKVKYTDDSKADEAITRANQAQSAATNASSTAATAKQVSEAANEVSNAAKALATEAKNNANEAITSSNSAKDIANDANEIAKEAQELADTAKTLADTANENAENAAADAAEAKAEASNASAKLSSWAADGKISPFEKQGVKDERAFVVADKLDIDNQIIKYNLNANESYEAFNGKYNAYIVDLNTILDAAKDSVVEIPANMEIHQSEYYSARTTILEIISATAKKVADDAQKAANVAQSAADDAHELATTANENANKAQVDATQALADAKEASEKADAAKTVADEAQGKLNSWLEDGVISPTEKTALANELESVKADFQDISNDCNKYGIPANDTTYPRKAFIDAYNTYGENLEYAVNNLSDGKVISQETAQSLKNYQEDYYMYRTAILSTISTFAKQLADDAKKIANEAKLAADAAKLATDNLNNDLVFSLTEKRSIRSKLKDINPSETQTISVNTFVLGAIESKGSGSWSKVTDETDANYGWYASNMHTDSSYAIAKVNLVNVVEGSSATVHIMSRAEATYDYTMLGAIDTELSLPTDTTTGVVAHTRGKQGQDISYTFTNLKEGSHFFCVYYRKDSSTSTSPDNGYFKIDDALFLKGSLGDYLALCKEKGISGSDAIAKATSLFAYLYGKGVWNNTDTVLSESDDFRNRVYGLFQDYYAAITIIQQEITKSDYEYLTEAFGKSQNLNVGGVVMSQLMAVRNEEENVEAIFNGSDFAEDTSHGKLILAGGIPEETSSGSTDLEARSKESNTRIYEDGHIVSKDLHLQDGCTIGDLEINTNALIAGDYSNGNFSGFSKSGFSSKGYSINKRWQETVIRNDCSGHAVLITMDDPSYCSFYDKDVALEINASNAYAILVRAGMVAGLRTKTRVITTAKTAAAPNVLNDLDYSVLVNLTSGTCYIALPQNPLEGQEYYIESRGATMNIKVYQQCYSLYSGSTTSANGTLSQSGRALLRFKYYAEASLWTCSWLNRNS